MATETIIDARYNGPPASGNGGYSCGVLAAHVPGAARVRLHVPPPLDTPLQVRRPEAGGAAMYDGERLVGSAEPATLDLAVPAAPSLAVAEAAMARFPCYEGHLFPTCFVCGPQRPAHDGLGLFPGAVPGSDLFACVWRPAADQVEADNTLRRAILWAALDCPGYFAVMGDQLRPAVLGELTGEIHHDVTGAQPLVVYAWPLGIDGRKYYAGTAIATGAGEVVASAKSTWIELKAVPSTA